ncbi:ulp1 protease family, C-terminal catalytic domain-containing protein [Tanacetum coccineum]
MMNYSEMIRDHVPQQTTSLKKLERTSSTAGSKPSKFRVQNEFRLKCEAAQSTYEVTEEKDRTIMKLEEMKLLTISTKELSDDDAYYINIFISKPSTNQPFIFDIDGRTLEYGKEDFYLITGFRFGKVNLDPDEEDHSKFRMRVFPKIENLKGEHLLELVNKDVKFAKLDDEDVGTFQRRVEEKLKLGPLDVDHLDKTDNLSKNAPDYGLDQQFMGGVSQYMNVDEPYKNRNEVSDNFHADGLSHKSVERVNQCTGLNDEYESVAVDGLISLRSQDVRELINDFFHTPSVQVQDACVSELLDVVKDDVNVNSVVKEEIVKDDVNVNSLVKEDIEKDDVQFDSVVKDAEQIENETLPRQKFPGKAYLSPYIQPPSTEVKCRKRRREIKLEKDVTRSPTAPKRTVTVPEEVNALFRDKNRMEMSWTFPWCADGHLVYIDFWEKLVGRSHTKRGWLSTSHLDLWIDYLWQFREPNADWAMASPYLCDMLSRFLYPLYYAGGVKYGVPWFANNVQKVYFPINEKDSHWIPLFLDNVEVFEKKNIVKNDYSISFQFADGVPIQGGLYGDCGLWVCIFLYRLSHNIPLEVDDPISFALAYCERLIEFYWKYKMLPE